MAFSNLYAYTGGNPISNFDPTGLAPPGQGSQGGYQIPCTWPGGCSVQPLTPEEAQLGGQIQQELDNAADNAIDSIRATAKRAADIVTAACHNSDNDRCYDRWEREDRACNNWSFLGPRAVRACQTRAADRRNMCIANGGKPHPDEPSEWIPSRDYMH